MTTLPQRHFWGVLGVVIGLLWTGHYPADAQQPALEPPKVRLDMTFSAERGALVISGWSADELEAFQLEETTSDLLSNLLQVRVALPERDTDSLPPVVGNYSLVDGNFLFRPRYGWSAGQRYETRLDLSILSELTNNVTSSGATLEASFTVSARTTPSETPAVTTVYPSADVLPENLLRFYIEFSQPMQRGEVYDHIYLLNADGQRVDAPFLRIGQEFWSPNMMRLTLLLDPGRIKRGVAPNVQAGSPLGSSTSYELVIEANLEDAHGRPLAQAHRKPFSVTGADHTSPDPAAWQLSQPVQGTRQPLVVTLAESIDPITAERFVRLENKQGQSVQGTWAFRGDKQALFTPETAWSAGEYRLAVHPSLEDYAGNRVDAVFDMEPGTVSELTLENRPIYRSFEIPEP